MKHDNESRPNALTRTRDVKDFAPYTIDEHGEKWREATIRRDVPLTEKSKIFYSGWEDNADLYDGLEDPDAQGEVKGVDNQHFFPDKQRESSVFLVDGDDIAKDSEVLEGLEEVKVKESQSNCLSAPAKKRMVNKKTTGVAPISSHLSHDGAHKSTSIVKKGAKKDNKSFGFDVKIKKDIDDKPGIKPKLKKEENNNPEIKPTRRTVIKVAKEEKPTIKLEQ
ncbi:hypothetical protein IAR55_002652 [Kwoniella newhampshirensis]|uniref:Uncharacterized protein n=1 Tax=Kwoniella newhampshirensis TaxID=1651941 RepID=A0AAW0YXG7_9TREE